MTGGLCLAGGPLHPSPGASLRLPASFHTHSGGVTCRTLTVTFLYPIQEGDWVHLAWPQMSASLAGRPTGVSRESETETAGID